MTTIGEKILTNLLKNKTCKKSTCNNKDLIEVDHYFDPENPNRVRDYWNLTELGMDNGLIMWSYRITSSTNLCTVPPVTSIIDNDIDTTSTPLSKKFRSKTATNGPLAEFEKEGDDNKYNNIVLMSSLALNRLTGRDYKVPW